MSPLTRQDVLTRVREELDAAWPGDQADAEVSVDDINTLMESVDDALDDLAEQIEDAMANDQPDGDALEAVPVASSDEPPLDSRALGDEDIKRRRADRSASVPVATPEEPPDWMPSGAELLRHCELYRRLKGTVDALDTAARDDQPYAEWDGAKWAVFNAAVTLVKETRLDAAVQVALPDRPTTVCLSGSSRFIDAMAVVAWTLEKRGHVTLHCNLLPSWYTSTPHHLAEEQGMAATLDDVHLRKIDVADELFVIDIGGYIGDSTRREIAYAERLGKRVLYLSNDETLREALDGRAVPVASPECIHPVSQVFFRAGLLACREYLARFVEVESPSIAASIRANWWPSLGADYGPPRKLAFGELTIGEYGTNTFRCLDTTEVSPTQEALPIALAFLQQPLEAAVPPLPAPAPGEQICPWCGDPIKTLKPSGGCLTAEKHGYLWHPQCADLREACDRPSPPGEDR